MNGLFFVGTDTGVGKTFVTAGVARHLRRQGRPVRVCKPVATGAVWAGNRWLSDDTRILAEAAGQAGDWEQVTPWTFPDPVAPPVAARRQGVGLKLEELARAVAERARPESALLVEGVGGLLCPLTEDATVADLVAAVSLPAVVVARRALGTLNHTLLTLEVARSRGLPVAGLVITECSKPAGLAEEMNVDELRRRIDVPLLAVIPYGPRLVAEGPSDLAAVDWWRLCQSATTDA